ncbi:redox-sensitive transcriptional activator SoxR [Frondihabitans australicus]|uniref:MerR family redox-sensitive transcriptional activator SoxR n=1 Tax=Frondihabitans australicus TaxID=386892 RepID=A0A495IL17_9MICO|nr:redox-sensitive transcriptional activator SoxR [Frondihabitans australicus]RKR76664.1 MerR family redox-sensitive transcriptional activator SoxR [Frondihabitans australicus]
MTKNSHDSLTIGEVARRSGATVATIRFYESKGLVHSGRTVGGTRVFARHALRRVSMVRLGVQLGIPLADIATAFESLPVDRAPSREQWQTISSAWNAQVEERIRTLAAMRAKLTDCIGCGCLSLGTCSLLNPDDALGDEGPGPQRVLRV